MSRLLMLLSVSITFAVGCFTSHGYGAVAGYDPFDDELPPAMDANWSGGTGIIDNVSSGFANTSYDTGDGLWGYSNAGLNKAVGWTVDARFQIDPNNTPGQRAFALLLRELNNSQVEVQVTKGNFFLFGEGFGGIGSSPSSPIPFDFSDGYHTLRVTRLGDNVRAYIDSTEYINASYTNASLNFGDIVYWGKAGGDNAGLASVDYILWDNGQSVQTAPGNVPGNNVPEPTGLLLLVTCGLFLSRRSAAAR